MIRPAVGVGGARTGMGEQGTAPAAHAFHITSEGARPLDWEACRALAASPPAEGYVWVHLDRGHERARRLLEAELDLPGVVVEALTDEATEPRAAVLRGGVLLVLRGRNRAAADALDRLVSARLYLTPRRAISVRLRPFSPSAALAEEIERGLRPPTQTAWLDRFVEITLDQLEPAVAGLGAAVDDLEALALAEPTGALRRRRLELNALKRAAVLFRRHLRPQSDALARLSLLGPEAAALVDAPATAERADQARRLAADVEEIYERTVLISGEIHVRVAERTNRTILTLTVVSTVFMPLSFAAGLLGVNLAGIPFAEQGWAFSAFAGGLGLLAAAVGLLVWRINRR